jgi:5-formyltetrahydrofolate cyclo-ligase
VKASKAELRAELTARRRSLTLERIDASGTKIQARFLTCDEYRNATTLALYVPIRGEVPTKKILQTAWADGKSVCFPVSHVDGRILSFRAIQSESELEPGRLGVHEPNHVSQLVPLDRIDLFVVPGLGFTVQGHRLGRGGGYYDATLRAASKESSRVGLAFAEQMVDEVPMTVDDVGMDVVVTETETYRA